MMLLGPALALAKEATGSAGWYFVSYSFKDASGKKNTSTSSGQKMYTIKSYTGKKNNITITRERYDSKTGRKLAGVVYQVLWSDPPAVLTPDGSCAFDFQLKTLKKQVWSAPAMWAHFKDGKIRFLTADGKSTVSKDMKTTFTISAEIPKSSNGRKAKIVIEMNKGFAAEYNYAWRE
jgi:hypothetical protein